jgi:peptide deformylase
MQRINYDTIIKDTDPSLRQKSVPLKLPLKGANLALAKRMIRYVRDSRDEEKAEKYNLKPAVGLAAPQVGAFVQLIAVVVEDDDGNESEYLLANPKIVSHSVQEAALSTGEGCLSVEEEHPGLVYRPARIRIKAYDVLKASDVEIRITGYPAIVMQHEIDHLHGILFYDHINPNDPWGIKENAQIIGD